jgi:hypothetical protein
MGTARTRLAVPVVSAVVMLGLFGPATAAEALCAPSSEADDFRRAEVVFEGRALPGPEDDGVLFSPARFVVLDYLKGEGPDVVAVETAAEMRDAILAVLPDADALVMAAAIADYRPKASAPKKLKRRESGVEMTLSLVENPDVLKAAVAARRPGTLVIGFKAETGDPIKEAGRMLREKSLDLVVANDVSTAVFGADADQVTFVSADGAEPLLGVTALESVGITVDPANGTLKRLPAVPLK